MRIAKVIMALSIGLCMSSLGLVCYAQQGTSKQDAKGNLPDEVNKSIKLLSSTNPVERATAACALGEQGAAAVAAIPVLVRLLGDETQTGPIRCWNSDEQRIASPESSPGKEAAKALTRIGEPAIEPVIAALKSDDWQRRANAALALGPRVDSRAVPVLMGLLKDEHWQVRAQATRALGRAVDNRALKPLASALNDEAAEVRLEAVRGLGHHRGTQTTPFLVMALKDVDWHVRLQAVRSLGRSDDARAVEALNSALKDENEDVRVQAERALSRAQRRQ